MRRSILIVDKKDSRDFGIGRIRNTIMRKLRKNEVLVRIVGQKTVSARGAPVKRVRFTVITKKRER